MAKIHNINVQYLTDKIYDEDIEKLFEELQVEGEIPVYILPGEIVAVPVIYDDEDGRCPRKGKWTPLPTPHSPSKTDQN